MKTTQPDAQIVQLRPARKEDPRFSIRFRGAAVASVWTREQAQRGVDYLNTVPPGNEPDYAAVRVAIFGV